MPLMTGNVTFDWALSTFVHAKPAVMLRQIARIFSRSILPAPGLVALPWLNRPNALCPDQTGCGAFFGVSPATSPADLLRAVVAAMVFEFARVLGPVVKSGAVDSLALCGGAAKSPHIRSLFAALFASVPVHQVIETEWMGARGCLYAFDAKIARARTTLVRSQGRVDANHLANACALYLETFARLCGDVPAGMPYVLKPKKHK